MPTDVAGHNHAVENMEERCETCKFFYSLPGYHHRNGACVRHSPTANCIGGGTLAPGWPPVYETSWCGDWHENNSKEVSSHCAEELKNLKNAIKVARSTLIQFIATKNADNATINGVKQILWNLLPAEPGE